jgi:Ni/Co efflux regulator RcnB
MGQISPKTSLRITFYYNAVGFLTALFPRGSERIAHKSVVDAGYRPVDTDRRPDNILEKTMRKIILLALMAATAVPGIAMAQSGSELRHDQRDIRQEQRELRDARQHGDRRDVREQRQDVRQARQEYREDWRDYRKSHKAVYARGNWRAPFRYTAWNTGARLKPVYYSSRYYINDPYRYRLPAARGNLKWVRHYNDVLLVNVRTGTVVQVNRGFFW